MAAIGCSIGRPDGSELFLGIGKKKQLIDTGFSGFSGSLDYIVRGRELVFLDYWTPYLAGAVFYWMFGTLWIDAVDQSTSDTKVSAAGVRDNGNNALIFSQGNYLAGSIVAVKSP